MEVWIARNSALFTQKIYIYKNKPSFHKGVFWGDENNNFLFEVDLYTFKGLARFTPRKGRCYNRILLIEEA